MKQFQIRQNFGQKIYGFEYFSISDDATIEEIEEKAIIVQINDYKNRFAGFSGKQKEKATIKVSEYINGKKVKGGVQFSTKWR